MGYPRWLLGVTEGGAKRPGPGVSDPHQGDDRNEVSHPTIPGAGGRAGPGTIGFSPPINPSVAGGTAADRRQTTKGLQTP